MVRDIHWLDKDAGWLHGTALDGGGNLYSFDVKVLEKPSRVGLYGSEIIKLIVWYGVEFSSKKIVLNYDEGWDISVGSSEESDVLKRVLETVNAR